MAQSRAEPGPNRPVRTLAPWLRLRQVMTAWGSLNGRPPPRCRGQGSRSRSLPRPGVSRRSCQGSAIPDRCSGLPEVLPAKVPVWNHFEHSSRVTRVWSEPIWAGRRRPTATGWGEDLLDRRAERCHIGRPGPGGATLAARDWAEPYRPHGATPSHLPGSQHPYVRLCSASGTD